MASRTNGELRAVLADGPEHITAAVFDLFADLFPDVAANPVAEQMVRAALALFAGLALQTIVDGDQHGRHAELRDVIKRLGRTFGEFPTPTVQNSPSVADR